MQAKKEMNITKIAAFFKYNAAMIGYRLLCVSK